jgi:inhibitor of growth protein 3
MSTIEREEQCNINRKDYTKVVEESKEYIQIAEESYGLVDSYLRKLDQKLHKFQLELEADNRGITEILEKRSLGVGCACIVSF